MEGRRANMAVFIMIMGVVAMQLQSSTAQTSHTVLDSSGWIIPSAANAYTTWAASKTFTVGDTLVFNFASGAHTAAEVTKAAYDACTLTGAISTWTAPPARVPLNSSGAHYYLCTIPGHCSAGQKLAVTVVAAATTAPPTPPPTATPPPSPTPSPVATPPRSVPAPSPTTTPTPSPSRSPSTAPTPSPSATPTPSPSTTPTPSPAPSFSPTPTSPSSERTPSAAPPASDTTPPPPPPNAAVSLAGGVLPVTILSVVMALFY